MNNSEQPERNIWHNHPEINLGNSGENGSIVEHCELCQHPDNEFHNKMCEVNIIKLILCELGQEEADYFSTLTDFINDKETILCFNGLWYCEYRILCERLHYLCWELNLECSERCYMCMEEEETDIKEPSEEEPKLCMDLTKMWMD